MKKITLFILSLVFLSMTSVNAQDIVANGGFENWTGGVPDDWTTIESGITVTEETTIIHGGSKSASVDVTTTSQGDTDFRQTVTVTGGVDYDVSVWVYHTEGALKARLYVGTYQNYSDNTITGAWQEVTYTYTAGSDGDIEIGLRFYDQTGFDGSEIVYVDDFTMVPQGGGGPTADQIYFEPFDADFGQTTQFNTLGAEEWYWANYGNPPGCAAMSGYSGGAQDNEDWLITNSFNCTNYTNVTLNFWHARNYADNSGLSVLISTDYDGTSDPTGFTWNDITSLFTFPATGSWSFIDAGTGDINALVGASTYVAFKYTSNTSDAATWEVDNIKVEGDFSISTFIAGSFNSWNSTDPDYEMSLNANGVMELTKNLGSGSHEYKAVEDGNWYPGNNQWINLSAAEDITWKWNYNADLVSHTTPVVAGNFMSAIGGNDWDPTEMMGEMTDPEGDDIYTVELTIPTGNWEAKVTLNRNWDQSTGGNVGFITDGVTPTLFTYDFTTNTTTISGPPPPSVTTTFIVDDSQNMLYDGFFLKGSWDANGQYDPSWGNGMEHAEFVDDGTNGDAVAGDHIWTCQVDLIVDGGTNTWEWGVNDSEHNWIAGNWQFTVPDEIPQTHTWIIPDVVDLVINEIMYNSIGADEEWIELYNNSDADINLENYRICDNDASHPNIVIPAGYSIAPGQYFTISIATNGAFPFTPDYDGTGNFALNNGGDQVRIWGPDNILVDLVDYSDTAPWPTDPDGNGPSLSLIDYNLDNNVGENWAPSNQEGGSPGAVNFPIVITAPNGGEIIETNSTFDITWTTDSYSGSILIELVREGMDNVLIVSNIPSSNGTFTWSVFGVDAANDYKIKITDLDNEDLFDLSDDYFTIEAGFVAPDLVITEIMYNPPESGNDSLEFLEIYNNDINAVNLEGFEFSSGVEFIFPNFDLLPDEYVLVAINSDAMMSTFGVTAYQWTSGALSNSGELVELTDGNGNVIDAVQYGDALPWDTLADGYGPSLTLCNPDSDNSLAENWTASVNLAAVNAEGDSIYATPGFGCQVELLAGFSADVTTVNIGGSVTFTDESIGDIIEWTWTFEGGTPETYSGQTPPPIVYDTEGTWDVTLLVSDGTNADELTIFDYIEVVDLAPPTNLMAEVGPFDDVQLTWTAPGPSTAELIYDNDATTGGYSYEGYTMSTHMSPEGPCKVLTMKFFTSIDAGDNTFNATLYEWEGTQPGTDVVYMEPATAVDGDWVEVDVSGQDIMFEGDFVVGFGSINGTTFLGYDANLNNGRSWDFDNVSTWASWNEAYVIRAVVEYTTGKIAEIGVTANGQISFTSANNATHSNDYSSVEIVKPIDNIVSNNRDLLGYNVYRDGMMINSALVEVTEYNDPEPTIGSHDYYVTAVYDGGESEPSNVVTVMVTDVNINLDREITMYPNPTDGKFVVDLGKVVSADVTVLDITGKVVYENSAEGIVNIDITGLEKGMYMVRVIDESNNMLVKKLILK